jgi:hypothetical protein
MYHVYKKGYSTLPDLRKIDPGLVFEKSNKEKKRIQEEKQIAIKNQKYFFEKNNPIEFYEACEEFIIKNYPRELKSKKYFDIAKEIDEDLIIHRLDGEKDYISSIHVCFPSHWYPEEKIGKSFCEVHSPVPMNLNNSSRLVGAIINNGIFERFVWSVVYENKYNFHPNLKNKKFNKEKPEIFIKVERQVTIGFPKEKFCLFVLRQYLIGQEEVDKKSLANSIRKMTEDQKKYKSLDDSRDLLFYLES